MDRVPNVALMWESSSPVGREILRGCVRYSRLHGPWSLHICGGDFDLGLPKNVDFSGIIAGGYSLRQMDAIQAARIPAVVGEPAREDLLAPTAFSGWGTIRTHGAAIAEMAVNHFRERGVGSLAYCGFEDCAWSRERERAFCREAEETGGLCSTYRLDVPNRLGEDPWARAEEDGHLRLAAWLKSLPRPTGLMVCDDVCGRLVLDACQQAELEVPEHIAVVGVGNDELACECSDPPLSSVALDVETAGYEAARLLDQLMLGAAPAGGLEVSIEPLGVESRRSSRVVVNDDPLVVRMLCFIEDHAGRGIGVPDVVSEIGVSRRTLERRFSRATGKSIHAQVTQRRLDRAKCLLQETDLPVYRVATEVGFANTRMLNRIFRRGERIPPTVFRRNSKEGHAAAR
jgi:LacI family transcriptional regulator